jgi:hypothetical protein
MDASDLIRALHKHPCWEAAVHIWIQRLHLLARGWVITVVGFFTYGRGLISVLITRITMLDVVFLAAATIFFLLTAAYAEGCEHL